MITDTTLEEIVLTSSKFRDMLKAARRLMLRAEFLTVEWDEEVPSVDWGFALLYASASNASLTDYQFSERRPGHAVPECVEDPFGGSNAIGRTEDPMPGALFAGRYLISRVLSMRGKGGVYDALDFSPKPGTCLPRRVVLKEAGEFAERDVHGVDAVTRLDRQGDFLRLISDLPGLPTVLSRFTMGSSTFMTISYIEDSVSLLEAATGETGVPTADFESLLRTFLNQMLYPIHTRGIVLNDISCGNLLLNPRMGSISICDLEEAIDRTSPDSQYVPLSTPGYTSKAWPNPSRERDLFAVARVALFTSESLWHADVLENGYNSLRKPCFDPENSIHRLCSVFMREWNMDLREVFF